jgi:integrase
MSVTVRPYRKGGWEVDIQWRLPNGRRRRERKRLTVTSKAAAQRWGESRERELLVNGQEKSRKEIPTLETFAPRFLDGHARANRHKPGGIAHKKVILRVHLVPQLGSKKLDAIGNEDVQRLKHHLRNKAVRTVNNVLTVLNTMLKKAVEWQVIDQMPCTVRLLKVTQGAIDFYDFDEYDSLVTTSASIDARAHLIVLLGGDAGLRSGEMRALEWTDVNFQKRQLCVERNDWRGQVSSTKGGRLRYVPLTQRLATALQAHRHLRSERILCLDDGRPMPEYVVESLLKKVARRANLRNNGPHILRHTFCSHLAMRGAPARAIQELAGHRDLSTTQRYMHLSPNAINDAIRLLEMPGPHKIPLTASGDIVETAIP